ncbi:hypothetical protein SETIT_6G148900v2 [Setaria italica]|uniref:Uncharacterized protein n=1 Tax=Setaria italica TaxID=4555 RepID=A0A368RNB1_SETIT|nr:hypothetical protein SETIT_6G148900v2 [Setaria italica]
MAPAAVAEATAASPPPPGPGPALARPELAAVKALIAAAAAVTHAAFPSGEGPRMIFALVLASLGGILFAALLANVVFLLLLRVALRDSDSILQVLRSLWTVLEELAARHYLTQLFRDVLSVVGCFLAVELSMGSQVGRIGTLAIDMGAVISAAISCLDILPSTALKLWRMKPGGGGADGCVV